MPLARPVRGRTERFRSAWRFHGSQDLYHKREIARTLLGAKSYPLMAAVTKRFATGPTAAAQPGFCSLKDHLTGSVPDRDLPLQMERPVRGWNHPQLSAGGHLLASVHARCGSTGVVECRGEVAVVA